MNKKEYLEPVMKPVLLKHQSHLMAGSEPVRGLQSNLAPEDEIEIGEKEDTYGKWGR